MQVFCQTGTALTPIAFASAGAAALVAPLMLAGFALQTAGLSRAKNAAHAVFGHLFLGAICLTVFWVCGFAVAGGRFFLSAGGAVDGASLASFFTQATMLAVAASVPLGALTERWSLRNLYCYGAFAAALLFPVFARWSAAGGWLAQLGFTDLAGAGTVHGLGGLCALAGVLVLGPRLGRYGKNNAPLPIPAHNVPLALLGCLVLCFGWFVFIVSRALGAGEYGRAMPAGAVAGLAAAGGALTAAFCVKARTGKPDPTIVANGALGGLVAVSGCAACVSTATGWCIGAIGGALVFVCVQRLDRWRVDDPVGAIAVHGAGGLWGVIATGMFANGMDGVRGLFYGDPAQLGAQLLGILVLATWAFGGSWVFFRTLDRFIPMRVMAVVELEGLDVPQTGVPAYAGLQHMSEETSSHPRW